MVQVKDSNRRARGDERAPAFNGNADGAAVGKIVAPGNVHRPQLALLDEIVNVFNVANQPGRALVRIKRRAPRKIKTRKLHLNFGLFSVRGHDSNLNFCRIGDGLF